MKSIKTYLNIAPNKILLLEISIEHQIASFSPKSILFGRHYPHINIHDFDYRCYVLAVGENEIKDLKPEIANIKTNEFSGSNDEKILDELYVQNFIKFDLSNVEINKQRDLKNFSHQKKLYVRQKSLDDIVVEVIVKNNQKYHINFI